MRIGIDVNGVLRNTLGKLESVYKKYMIDKVDGIDSESEFTYEIVTPIINENYLEHFKFKDEADLNTFLYEEFSMEIFGHAGSAETMTFNDLNEFYLDFRNKLDIIIVSNEVAKSKPATLFFLSKFGCQVETIKFFSDITIGSMWDNVDLLVTASPKTILNAPKDKIIIKYATPYNDKADCELTISSIKELTQIIEKKYV